MTESSTFSRIAIVNRGEAAMRLVRAVREARTAFGNELISIALRMKTSHGSRVILDGNGAEKLLGKGDALLLLDCELVRIQAFLIDKDYDRELRLKCASARPSEIGRVKWRARRARWRR